MRRTLLKTAGLVGLALVGGFIFAYAGFYNVAASQPHNPVIRWLLDLGMRQSVAAHAGEEAPPALGDPALIERGAQHFATNCASCHGAPGEEPQPMVAAMLPEPPRLADKIDRFNEQELFWIIKHGLKYTGMPGWPTQDRDDEVWAMVAFVRLLPQMSADAYQALMPDLGDPDPTDAVALVEHGDPDRSPTACARCHGVEGMGVPSGAFPVLAGLPADYIKQELDAFASGERPSGIMQAALVGITEAERRRLADYYAGIEPPQTPGPQPNAQSGGARLVFEGNPDRGVPACLSCHADERNDAPPLAGQPAGYIATQLLLFRNGVRSDNVMSEIAENLTDEQINAAATWFGTAAF